jgi:hypothetical protein
MPSGLISGEIQLFLANSHASRNQVALAPTILKELRSKFLRNRTWAKCFLREQLPQPSTHA